MRGARQNDERLPENDGTHKIIEKRKEGGRRSIGPPSCDCLFAVRLRVQPTMAPNDRMGDCEIQPASKADISRGLNNYHYLSFRPQGEILTGMYH